MISPTINGPERKRILGVLAQRRYRARKRQQQKHASAQDPLSSTSTSLGWTFGGETLSQPSIESTSDTDLFLMNTPSNEVAMTAVNIGNFMPTITEQRPTSEHFLEPGLSLFADDHLLQVPILKIMRAGVDIATRLGCETLIWDPKASHVLPWDTANAPTLPLDFRPVEAQMKTPHHPVFDVLPWPSVRTKLILVFSMPIHLRPPAARDPLALINLVYDIDDEKDGCRIFGEDGLSAASWDIGQKVFENWWWAFDRDTVRSSNILRRQHGLQDLTLR